MVLPPIRHGVVFGPQAQRSIALGDFIDFLGKNSRPPKKVEKAVIG